MILSNQEKNQFKLFIDGYGEPSHTKMKPIKPLGGVNLLLILGSTFKGINYLVMKGCLK